jgi:hypothetical protein
VKKHIAGLFGFALLLATASAHAQITQTVRVQVPFTVTRAQTTIKLGATSWGYLIVPVAINGSGPTHSSWTQDPIDLSSKRATGHSRGFVQRIASRQYGG